MSKGKKRDGNAMTPRFVRDEAGKTSWLERKNGEQFAEQKDVAVEPKGTDSGE